MTRLITPKQNNELFDSNGKATKKYYELAREGFEVVEVCVKNSWVYFQSYQLFDERYETPKVSSPMLLSDCPRPKYYPDPEIPWKIFRAIELFYQSDPSVLERLSYFRLCDRIGQLLLHS
ncbi:MAG: hypothetical protein J7647_22325 [Cyanobacteria bacterium SBLK]|nr:hypothetical protein [Cyanobacteria bacterium SBLK]